MTFRSKLNDAFQRFEDGDLKEAERIYNDLFAEELSATLEIQVRFNYGYLLVEQNKLVEALNNYQRTLDLAYHLNDKTLISQSYHQIGMVHRVFGEYVHALIYFQKERDYIDEHFSDNLLFLAANDYEMGVTNLLNNQFTRAKDYLDLSLKHALNSDDHVMIACSYRGLGDYYKASSETNNARKMYNKSIHFFMQANDQIGVKEVEEKIHTLNRNSHEI